MDVMKVGLLGVIGILLAVYFRTIKAEYGTYIGIATGIMVFGYTMQHFAYFMEQIQTLKNLMEAERDFFSILIRVVCITYICEFCAGICKDAGYGAVGGQIELFGKVMVLMAGLPILLSVIDTIQKFKG